MKLEEIKDLLKSFDLSKSTYLELDQQDFKIKLKKEEKIKMPAGMPTQTMSGAAWSEQVVTSQAMESQAMPEQSEAKEQNAFSEEEGEQVKAPLVGIFYAAASPEAEAYVQVGTKVEEGQVLCLIEAMKMMNEITAPKSGTIKKIYVKNQDVVAYEDPLFLIGD